MLEESEHGSTLLELRARGQSVWLDDLHRRMLRDGSLARLVERDGVSGVTSNPAIFAAAIMAHDEYVQALEQLAPTARDGGELYEALVMEDIRGAADLLRPVYERTGGRDGFVSLEVSPHLAHDTPATVAEAQRLWNRIARPNTMIKVPGTAAGLQAISPLIGAGVNVNVTLLFSPSRYFAVAEAYMSGLEIRGRSSADLASVASVASFFLSRIDSDIDRRLDRLAQAGAAGARDLRGRAAVASACAAYELYTKYTSGRRWRALAAAGARPQRLLWASTSTKDPSYPDTKYVDELIATDTVNTMPLATLTAYRDHGKPGPGLEPHRGTAEGQLRQLLQLGIDVEDVARHLETEGVRKFAEPFDQLQDWLTARLERAARRLSADRATPPR